MILKKTVHQLWNSQESGLVVPEGTVTDLSQFSSQTYLKIKEKAIAIENLYASSNVVLSPSSDLAQLIADAKKLSDSWLIAKESNITLNRRLNACYLVRIAEAVLTLQGDKARYKYLSALVSGSLKPLDRKKSKAKDILWEIKLLAILKGRSFKVTLEEPPDIVVDFEHSRIGIACKKLYSEKHVQNVLSKAVNQIETSFDFGIVAFNLDDLMPPNQILCMPTKEALEHFISDFNNRFLRDHEKHFRKYLSLGRIISALVSTDVLADIYQSPVRFNNARESLIWTIQGLPPRKERELKKFYYQLVG